jgi:hypothetical protein
MRTVNITVLLSLVGVVIGWMLNEASSLLRERREQKKTYGRALLRLMQLREMFDVEIRRTELAKELRERGKFTEGSRKLLAQERQKDLVEFLEGSNEPLSEVSTADPVLSYELNRHIRRMTNVVTAAGAYADPPALDEWNKFWENAQMGGETVALKFLISDTEKLMLRVARRNGIVALTRTKGYLRQQRELRSDYPTSRLADHHVEMGDVADDLRKRFSDTPREQGSKQ